VSMVCVSLSTPVDVFSSGFSHGWTWNRHRLESRQACGGFLQNFIIEMDIPLCRLAAVPTSCLYGLLVVLYCRLAKRADGSCPSGCGPFGAGLNRLLYTSEYSKTVGIDTVRRRSMVIRDSGPSDAEESHLSPNK